MSANPQKIASRCCYQIVGAHPFYVLSMSADFIDAQQKSEFVVMLRMRFIAFLILPFINSLVFAQQHKDYIIKPNKDTVFTKVVRMHKKMNSVVCEERGKNVKYEAKDVLELKYDTAIYETGLVQLKRSKQFVFLRRTVKGKLSLYEISVKKTKFLWDKFGYDFIRLRWVYRAQDWSKKYPVTIDFYKKEIEPKEKFSKFWKEKTEDCQALTDKIKSKAIPWSPSPRELVQYYNENCK